MTTILPQTHSDQFYEDAYERIRGIFNNCSPIEQNMFLKILDELSVYGASETLDNIYLIDFKEVPVSIERFLKDEEYLGSSNDNGNQIYPGWWEVYNNVFDAQKDIYEVCLSGATRIGKSSTAVSCMCYMLYLLMCYRNPQKYFGLKEVSRATIAFANLTKDLALGVAYREFHDTLLKSPWFTKHGTKNNSATKPIFIPEGNQIEIVAASDAAHVLGMQLWACLVGDTKIATSDGYCTLADACNSQRSLLQIDNSGSLVRCNATIKCTKYVTDTIKILLSNSESIEGTEDHKVMLFTGEYKMLSELKQGDVLYSFNDSVAIVLKSYCHYGNPIPVYDVINAGEFHNFLIYAEGSLIVSHNCCMDEVNFSRAGIKDIDISKRQMQHMYNTANARITGTFKLDGHIYGKMFTCSSKNSDNDYLSDHIEKQLDAGNNHMFLFDKPQWEVLPAYRFGKEKFYITVGDRYKRGFVVPDENSDEEHLQEYRNEGYKVLEVPADYKPNFKADYDIALRDIAGISVVGAMGFITQEMITPNIADNRVNPFFEDYYEIGLRDNDTIERHFHLEVVPNYLKQLPMNIHIDFAEKSDHIGISGAAVDGNKTILDLETNKKILMPYIRQIFQVAIGAPRGDRMSFQKVINFIIWLRRNGFNIGIVSTDQYQSAYVRENLDQQGFTCEKVSVDRTIDPYISLRNLLQDQRLELIKCDLQEVELINLQRNNDRIDHKPQSNAGAGSAVPCLANGYNSKGIGKDCADAICGACSTLLAHLDLVKPPAKNVINAISSVNSGNRGPFPNRYGTGTKAPLPGFGAQYRKF